MPITRNRRAIKLLKVYSFLRVKPLLSRVLRRAVTGFKIPKTFAKRRNATFEQKLPVSQSQIVFAIIIVQFLMSKYGSVLNGRHHNRMANHHRAMQSC